MLQMNVLPRGVMWVPLTGASMYTCAHRHGNKAQPDPQHKILQLTSGDVCDQPWMLGRRATWMMSGRSKLWRYGYFKHTSYHI